MPELIVSMPARNTGSYVREAVQSVLAQRGIDFQLVVVDDSSEDDTATVVQSFDDYRIRLFRNERRLGVAACHNLVLRNSDSRFIAHVDSDDVLLPGALARVVARLQDDDDAHYAHCNYELIGESGGPLIQRRLAERRRYLRERTADMDHKRELILRGGEAANHLRTYRRSVFGSVGDFDEHLSEGSEDYDMALRIVDRYPIRLVPEVWYRYRIHSRSTTGAWRLPSVSFLVNRWRICQRLTANGRIAFTRVPEYEPRRLMFRGFLQQALGSAFGGAG